MAKGHIELGEPGLQRPYSIANEGKAISRSNANPFAAKINTSNEYEELQGWNEWVLEDWQSGVGKRIPDDGGTLYSFMDTRFPSQVILPLGFDYPLTQENLSGGVDYTSGDSIVDGSTITKASTKFHTGTVEYDILTVWVYLDAAEGTTVTASIYTNSSNKPSASSATGTAVVSKYRPGPIWQRIILDGATLTADTDYHIVVSADASLTLPKMTPKGGMNGCTYNGTSWTTTSYTFAFLTTFLSQTNNLGLQNGTYSLLQQAEDEFLLPYYGDKLKWVVRCRDTIFVAYANQFAKVVDGAISAVTTTTSEITSVIVAGDTIFIAYQTGYKTYAVSTATVTDYSDVPAHLFYLDGTAGYLYMTTEHYLYYTTDGIAWTAVDDPVGWGGHVIRGMAALNGDLYLATDEGLYWLAPGDFIKAVKKWPTISSYNGRNMVEWNGALYIPLAEDIVRYDSSGGMIQIGLRTGEALPLDIQGKVYGLTSTPYFLLASIENKEESGYGSLWAWNGTGWHGIGLLPQGVQGGAMRLDSDNGYLYLGGGYGLLARAKYPSSVVNPIRDGGEKLFARYGWMEYDSFYGGFVSLDKDYDSIYIDTESMTNGTITLYWKDQDSTGWELLGSETGEDFELRWSDYDTRPNSKWLKMGILFRTDYEQETPIMRAHSLKYHPMISDRWRWQISIQVHDDQQMLDGTMNDYNATQMIEHLDSMIDRVPPFILTSMDGTMYEVKVIAANIRPSEYEYHNGTTNIKWIVDLSLEQVTDSAYT